MRKVGIFIEERKFDGLGLRKFVESDRSDGLLQFVQISENEPFECQGPFDLILHKSFFLLKKDERKYFDFEKYAKSCTRTVFLDNLDAVTLILNRYKQFEGVSSSIQTSGLNDVVTVPLFCLCDGHLETDICAIRDTNLRFPAICKPLLSHGNAEAHKMMIIFRESDLSLVNCPSVLQSFVNHNGFLIKAYVIGSFFHLVLRPSIKNLYEEQEAIIFNSQDVSKEYSRSFLNNDQDLPKMEDLNLDRTLIKRSIDAIRKHLNLDLIGVDFVLLHENVEKQNLAVIDVNIFPDYSCVPDFHFHLENLIREKLNLPSLPYSEEIA